MEEEQKNMVEEPFADYEKAEIDLLRSALKRTYKEPFHMMASLMKMNIMFRQAEIKHKILSSTD